MEALFNLAFGYLLGLAALGYLGLWIWLQRVAKQRQWPMWTMNMLVGAHFVLGVSGLLLVPALLVHKINDSHSIVGPIVFLSTIVTMLWITFLVSRDLNRIFRADKSETIIDDPTP